MKMILIMTRGSHKMNNFIIHKEMRKGVIFIQFICVIYNKMESFKGGRGGIGGSGIFGGVGVGAGVVCNATDQSMYCTFIKFVTVVMYVAILLFLLNLAYNYFTSKSMRGGSGISIFSMKKLMNM
jgi:hypothetical protein